MSSIFCEVSKYLMIVLFALYTWSCFYVLRKKTKEEQRRMFRRQKRWMFLLHLNGYLVLLVRTGNYKIMLFYAAQVVFFLIIMSSYRLIYEQSAQLLVNNMCMLIAIGFLILSRLSYEKAIRQFTPATVQRFLLLLQGFPYSRQNLLRLYLYFLWPECCIHLWNLGGSPLRQLSLRHMLSFWSAPEIWAAH